MVKVQDRVDLKKKKRVEPPPKTGWPAHKFLLQDDCSALSRWFASKPEARYLVRKWASALAVND